MKTLCMMLCYLFCISLFQVHADTVQLDGTNGLKVGLLSSDSDKIQLEVLLGNFEKSFVDIDGVLYHHISLKREPQLLQKGAPQLPKITRNFAIPNNAKMEVKVVDQEYVEMSLKIAPSKGVVSRSVDINSMAYTFSDIYKTDGYFPSKIVSLGTPYLIRNVRGIALDLFPFAYNPMTQTLRVYTKIVVEINNVGSDIKNSLAPDKSNQLNENFNTIYKNHFMNFTSSQLSPVLDNGRMIVICHDAFCDAAQPYVDWKNQKGIPTTKVAVSTIGNTGQSIKNYIQTEYNKNDGLTFVQLVGDASHVSPFYNNNQAQDPSYALTAGDDNYPDILIGRFSADSVADVETQVARTIYYERDMPAADWLDKATNIASDEGAGNGDDGESDWQHARKIRTELLKTHMDAVDELYDGSQGGEDASGNPTPTALANVLNQGRSLVNYTGHGGVTNFVTSGFSNTDVNNLTNENKLPLIVAVACVVGQFENTTSFSESWLRATNNGNPTGAIAIYASSINQSWKSPMSAQDEIVDLMVAKTYQTVGGLLYNGSIKMISEYGEDGANMFKTWHIFGDASLKFINTGTTKPINADFNFTKNNFQVDFQDTSSSDNTITQWVWDFGDGNSSTQQNPSHTYATAGTYTVSLAVTNENNLSESISKDLVIGLDYCGSRGVDFSYEWIENVTMGTFSKTSDAAGYSDFTSEVISLSKTTNNLVSLKPGFGGSTYGEYWRIWIDLNWDGDFNDTGELIFEPSASSQTITGNISLPGSALIGTTRMRVSMQYANAPAVCGDNDYGEVEDYTVNIE
ncbi:MAG: PKD domain-containing protein [Desulfobacteraceae bacterium]|nr:PKD domain-containing protein [Desulfobacteraceae bacterium]